MSQVWFYIEPNDNLNKRAVVELELVCFTHWVHIIGRNCRIFHINYHCSQPYLGCVTSVADWNPFFGYEDQWPIFSTTNGDTKLVARGKKTWGIQKWGQLTSQWPLFTGPWIPCFLLLFSKFGRRRMVDTVIDWLFRVLTWCLASHCSYGPVCVWGVLWLGSWDGFQAFSHYHFAKNLVFQVGRFAPKLLAQSLYSNIMGVAIWEWEQFRPFDKLIFF